MFQPGYASSIFSIFYNYIVVKTENCDLWKCWSVCKCDSIGDNRLQGGNFGSETKVDLNYATSRDSKSAKVQVNNASWSYYSCLSFISGLVAAIVPYWVMPSFSGSFSILLSQTNSLVNTQKCC